jgi:type IV pilus modification protein PilV
MNTLFSKRQQRGVSLIEALVSLLVLALGMMSFASLQGRLRQNSDVAKQRAEAVRIAQEDLENFRAFSTFAVNNTITNNFAYDSVSASAVSKTVLASGVVTKTNTAYTVSRVLSESPQSAGITDAPTKNLAVTVSWADRTGTTQSVTLRTMISRSDPAVAASLALAPNGSPVRDLLGRDIQVPIPAKSLGDGTSAIKPFLGGTVAYVFNNDTGLVTKRCTNIASSTATSSLTLADINAREAAGDCTSTNAYLVSGFVRSSLGNTPDVTNPNDVAPGGVSMRFDFDKTAPPTGFAGLFDQLLASYWPALTGSPPSSTGITKPGGPIGVPDYTPAECNAQPLRTIRYTTPVNYTQVNNGNTTTVTSTTVIAIIPQSVTSITSANVAPWVGVTSADAPTKIVNPQATGELFIGFACLVYPIDLDGNGATPVAFTGRLTVLPTTNAWALGTNVGEYKICRYSADYNLNGGVRIRTTSGGVVSEVNGVGTHVKTIDNQEHTYAYLNAQKSLSNQSFLIVSARKSTGGNPAITCPTDSAIEVNGQGGENYTDESTVTHQP